jgi:8-oxo-dGTP pyrophosphatase MutT (NUDIX family)
MKTWFGAIVLVYKTNPLRILLVKNKKSGNVGPVSGALEGNETELQAAARELKEEIGWKVNPVQLAPLNLTHDFIYGSNKPERMGDKGSNQIFTLNADILPDPLETEDIKNTEWLSPEEAIQKISFDDLKEIIKQSIDQIHF